MTGSRDAHLLAQIGETLGLGLGVKKPPSKIGQ
jgi:hypothetical protein